MPSTLPLACTSCHAMAVASSPGRSVDDLDPAGNTVVVTLLSGTARDQRQWPVSLLLFHHAAGALASRYQCHDWISSTSHAKQRRVSTTTKIFGRRSLVCPDSKSGWPVAMRELDRSGRNVARGNSPALGGRHDDSSRRGVLGGGRGARRGRTACAEVRAADFRSRSCVAAGSRAASSSQSRRPSPLSRQGLRPRRRRQATRRPPRRAGTSPGGSPSGTVASCTSGARAVADQPSSSNPVSTIRPTPGR
jgi:hypothetical protein